MSLSSETTNDKRKKAGMTRKRLTSQPTTYLVQTLVFSSPKHEKKEKGKGKREKDIVN